ncbi:MAG: NADH-quinone oxidoreductase subunit N [Acidimicrobiales bacterium]
MTSLIMVAASVPSSSLLPPLKLPHVEYSAILPELILIGGALVLLTAASLFRSKSQRGLYAAYTVGVSVASLVASVWLWQHLQDRHGHGYTAVAGAVAVDGFSVFFLVMMSVALIISALMSHAFLRRERLDGPEFYVLAMLSVSGGMFMSAANDLILLFLGLEILSIALYVLAGYNSQRAESGEAAIKYFVLGAFSSALFLYGIALTYGATGSTNLAQIADYLARNVITSNGVLLAGMALMLVGLGFKVAAVPFHAWTPDVYQGSPSPVTGFMAAVAKAAGFAGLLRVFYSTFPTLRLDWEPAIWVIAVLTLALGSIVALVQSDVKRMMAYSSINHAGFVLVGLQAASTLGIAGSLYYLFAYTFLVLGSFAVITLVGGKGDADHDLTAYRGLYRRNPLLALAFVVFLMAQAGIPFTTGFLAKFYVISAAASSHSYALAIIAMVSAVVAAFFYLRVMLAMFSPTGPSPRELDTTGSIRLPEPMGVGSGPPVSAGDAAPTLAGYGVSGGDGEVATSPLPSEAAPPTKVVVPVGPAVAIALCVAFTVVFGIIPGPIIDFAHQATLLF